MYMYVHTILVLMYSCITQTIESDDLLNTKITENNDE